MNAVEERDPLRVVGRYALYHEIAAGGMATVHIGRLLGPVGFARTVAVKRLHPQFAKDPEFVSMFLDEARLAARVQHPNVVATIDVVATDGELFLIMDYVRGESLSKLLRIAKKHNERIPPKVAASVMCGFLHGLHAAHEAKDERGAHLNLVHRDVSPQNVLVGADGIARVLDFGIAKASGRIQVTKDGQIKGKLAYMPPEQLAAKDLSRAVDIYAAAVVMWEALTGERLFKGESEAETLGKILHDPVLPPSSVVPSLPRGFDAPLMRALSRDPSKRHTTARELALELERCIGLSSPTDVGEWVERIAGPALSARESRIAEIESNSARIPVMPSKESSDSDMHAIHTSDAGTFIGVGPPSSPPAPSSNSAPFQPPSGAYAKEEISRSQTGTAMRLPVDKRSPIIFAAIGASVVLALLGWLIVRVVSHADAQQSIAPPASAFTTASATTTAAGDPTNNVVPPPTATAAASASASAAPEETKTAPKATVKPVAPPPPPAAKKNCDPPYTIDANGRRKYKLECM